MKKLTDSDFIITKNDVFINFGNKYKKQPGLLLIWADWCPHCHTFLPVFKNIDKKIGNDFSMLSVEYSVLEKNPSLNQALSFQGFPTIKFFNQYGKITETYNGSSRSEKDVLDYICKIYHKCL